MPYIGLPFSPHFQFIFRGPFFLHLFIYHSWHIIQNYSRKDTVSSTQEFGAISFYRVKREHGPPWQRLNSAVNTRPFLLASNGRQCNRFCYQNLLLYQEKKTTHSSCCSHAVIFFSRTIRGNWFRLPPS